jgi:cell division protein FtsI/penicillin-binding protein 2
MLGRASAIVAVGAIVGVGLVRTGPASPEPVVTKFLLDWQSRQYKQAAELTTGQPDQVAGELASAYQELDATNLSLSMHGVSQQGKTGHAQFHASVDLGDSGLIWSYLGGFGLRDGSAGWRVVWSPSVIVPGMRGSDELAVVTNEPPRSQILDRAGKPLTLASPAYQIGVVPGALKDPEVTANELSALTQIPANQIEGRINASPSRDFLELVTLPPAEYRTLRPSLLRIPGVRVEVKRERLFQSVAPAVVGSVGTETASVLRRDGVPFEPGTTVGLSGLQQTFQRRLAGTGGTEVVLQQGRAVDILRSWPAAPGKPVQTTLDSGVQEAADRAVDAAPGAAAIVAVQASTGQILAVSSHNVAGQPDLSPLAGEYQPGQAFTIISSAAILGKGVAADGPVPCKQVNNVNGQRFVNDPPELGLGNNAPFGKDFAYACSTAFVGMSESLTRAELAAAAARFGVGGWQLPVSSYFAGQIGQPSGEVALAEDTIGTGDVRVSPLGMALAAAVVDSGRWHSPSLVTGMADAGSEPSGTESPQVLSELRTLMREAVASGAGKSADVGGNVAGQVGNAPFAAGLRISWFVGYQGDIAFAAVELGKSASGSAAPLAGSFLQKLGPGS